MFERMHGHIHQLCTGNFTNKAGALGRGADQKMDVRDSNQWKCQRQQRAQKAGAQGKATVGPTDEGEEGQKRHNFSTEVPPPRGGFQGLGFHQGLEGGGEAVARAAVVAGRRWRWGRSCRQWQEGTGQQQASAAQPVEGGAGHVVSGLQAVRYGLVASAEAGTQAAMLGCCCLERSSAEGSAPLYRTSWDARRTGQASAWKSAAQVRTHVGSSLCLVPSSIWEGRPVIVPHHCSHHTLIPGFQHRPHQHCSAGHHIWSTWELRSSRPGKAYINASKLHGTIANPCACTVLQLTQIGCAFPSSPVQLPGVCIPLLHLALPLLKLRLPVLASRQAGHVGVAELATARKSLQQLSPNTVSFTILEDCVIWQLQCCRFVSELQSRPAAQPLGLEHAADSTELMDKAQLTHTGKTCGCLAGHVRGLATRLPAAAGTCRPCQDFCCCLPQGLRQVAAQATSGIAATCNRWQQQHSSQNADGFHDVG
eukprot:jgi/Astpho2/6500/fgenesh1_pg.00096_%23_28_t